MGLNFSFKAMLKVISEAIIKSILIQQGMDTSQAEVLSKAGAAVIDGVSYKTKPLSPASKFRKFIYETVEESFGAYKVYLSKTEIDDIIDNIFDVTSIDVITRSNDPVDSIATHFGRLEIACNSADLKAIAEGIIFHISEGVQNDAELLALDTNQIVHDIREVAIDTSQAVREIHAKVNNLPSKELFIDEEAVFLQIHADNRLYQQMLNEPLFLEDTIGGKAARLRDVFIKPQYVVNRGGTRLCIYKMLKSFLTARETFTFQQNRSYPKVNKRIFAVMLLGKPGSGKSSFVAYLSKKLSDKEFNNRSYYIIRLRDMFNAQINDPDPVQGLLNYMEAKKSHLQKAILILDGLDEICAIYQKTNFHVYLEKLLQGLSCIEGLQLILTSRTGYFNIDNKITDFCLIVNIENWDNGNLEQWAIRYSKIHPLLKGTIEKNVIHLQNEQYSDKRTIFAVPILFYMANAKKEYLEDHSSICSVYDAVLRDVFELRSYDQTPYLSLHELISPGLSRQICREIAFMMFRIGRVSLKSESDPFLAPDEVNIAIETAMRLCSRTQGFEFTEEEKKKIKNLYALSFYYNKKEHKQNAVEFAHKSIAEYFIAEKMLELLFSTPEKVKKRELCLILAECFGYSPITTDIALFLHEKIKMHYKEQCRITIKNALENNLRDLVLSGELFISPTYYESKLHYLDRATIMTKSALMLYEYFDCVETGAFDEFQMNSFNSVIANISRITAINPQNNMLLPFSLNALNLSNGDFSYGEFCEAHLCETDLSHSKFTDANFLDAQLHGAIITNADFSGANLEGADLTGIKKSDAADFTQAKLQGADLSGAIFTNTSFEEAQMQSATLKNCIFGEGCHFEDANLYSADLTGADISKACIDGILFDDDEDMGEDEPFVISALKLSKAQHTYLLSFSNLRLDVNCTVL